MATIRDLLNDIPHEPDRSKLAALIGLNAFLDDRFLDGLERVMDGLCPDCGEAMHEGDVRCHNFRPLQREPERASTGAGTEEHNPKS